MGGLGGWAPAPALFRTTPDMMVVWDVRFNGDGTGVGADDGGDGVVLRGKVIVGREGTVRERGSIFVGGGPTRFHALFGTYGVHK